MPELALVDLERALVGTLLAHNHTVVPVASALTPNDLTDPLCRNAYTVILDLAHAATPPNAYTVAAKLATPVQALLDLQARSNPTLASEIMALAGTLRKDANRRRVVGIAEDILRDASRPDVDVDGLVYVAVQQLAQAVEGQSDRPADFASIGAEVEAELAEENVLPGAPTGMAWLTERTNGLRPGKFWSIIAPLQTAEVHPCLRNMVIAAAEAKYQVLMCALEGTREDFYLDIWAMLATRYMHRTLPPDVYQEESFLDGEHLRASLRTPAQHSALEQTRPQMQQIGKYLRVLDARDRIIDLSRFTARVQRERFMYGTQIIFIDYLQKLASTGKTFDRVERAVMTIQDVIAPEGITAVVLSQVNEEKVMAGDTGQRLLAGGQGRRRPASGVRLRARHGLRRRERPGQADRQSETGAPRAAGQEGLSHQPLVGADPRRDQLTPKETHMANDSRTQQNRRRHERPVRRGGGLPVRRPGWQDRHGAGAELRDQLLPHLRQRQEEHRRVASRGQRHRDRHHARDGPGQGDHARGHGAVHRRLERVTWDSDALDALCASDDNLARILLPHRTVKPVAGSLTIK